MWDNAKKVQCLHFPKKYGIGVYSIVLVSRVGPIARGMGVVSTNFIRLTRFVLTFASKRYSINLGGSTHT